MTDIRFEQALARADRRRLLLWIGATGAGLVALAGTVGFHDASVWRLPAVLQARAEAALSAAGLPGIEVEMRGQAAHLHGVVANAAAVPLARQAALTSSGSGGLWTGGVTSVDTSGLSVGAIDSPFVWNIQRQPATVTLSGAVPSAATRTALHAEATAAFPNARIVDSTHIAGGAPSAHWREAAIGALRALAPFSGQAQFTNEDVVFTVQGSQQAIAELHQRYQAPPPFRARIEASATP